MVGVSAVVLDDRGHVFLVHSTENGGWMPADAVVQEVFEEAAVRCVPEHLVGVNSARAPLTPTATGPTT